MNLKYLGKEQVTRSMLHLSGQTSRVEGSKAYFDGIRVGGCEVIGNSETYGDGLPIRVTSCDGESAFSMFETIAKTSRENTGSPSYSRSDDTLNLNGEQIPVRMSSVDGTSNRSDAPKRQPHLQVPRNHKKHAASRIVHQRSNSSVCPAILGLTQSETPGGARSRFSVEKGRARHRADAGAPAISTSWGASPT